MVYSRYMGKRRICFNQRAFKIEGIALKYIWIHLGMNKTYICFEMNRDLYATSSKLILIMLIGKERLEAQSFICFVELTL